MQREGMQPPMVGDVVWYWESAAPPVSYQPVEPRLVPRAAIVTQVLKPGHPEGDVQLNVFGTQGRGQWECPAFYSAEPARGHWSHRSDAGPRS